MVYLWKREADGVERLIGIVHVDYAYRVIVKSVAPGRYTWQHIL